MSRNPRVNRMISGWPLRVIVGWLEWPGHTIVCDDRARVWHVRRVKV